jgi:hypothetical protein
LLQIRCGGNNNEYEYDDEENDLYDNSGDDEYSDGEYDEENEEEEGDAPASATLQRRPVAHNNHDMRRPPPPARRPPPPRQKSNPTMLGMASKLAKKTASMTKTVAVSSVKGSGKAAYYLASPKHVTRRELWGVWRLDQQGTYQNTLTVKCLLIKSHFFDIVLSHGMCVWAVAVN